MHSIGLQSVVENVEAAIRDGNLDAAEQLLTPAMDQRPQTAVLWFYYGSLCVARGQNALGLQCLLKSLDLDPHPAIWGNAAACLRNMQQIDACRKLLQIGLEHDPGNVNILANLCGSYVNEGDPLPGIEVGNQVKDHPEVGPAVKFNLALLNLEAGNLAEGFELYASGRHSARELRTYEPDPPELTRELHEEFKGQLRVLPKAKLLVYGEQGLGDELMFATMLGQASEHYDIVFDSHPRLQWLHEHSSWHHGIELTGTRKVRDRTLSSQGCDAKLAIGNLARFYRAEVQDFPAGPFYNAPQAQTAQYRAKLEQLAAGRKIIGLATRGGLMQTARLYRMMPMDVLEQLFADPSLMLVSLDYEDMTSLAQWAQKFGPNKFIWHPSIVWHWQYEHTAALVAATDAVVTVPQTVAHLSAAMGHPTYVMTPSRPDWRLGLTGETWYWYPNTNTRLLRQQGQSFQPALDRLFQLLQARALSEAA
jgi:tetratricopeptide (TPR) repeat protein